MSKVVIAVFAGMLGLFVLHFGGIVEGRVFPVTRDTELMRIEPDGVNRSLVWGRSVRQRECSFVRLEWRIGSPHHYAVIDVEFLESSKVRGGGVFEFGPWRLHATEAQITGRSFATAVHRCHPFWLTETRFYPDRTGS